MELQEVCQGDVVQQDPQASPEAFALAFDFAAVGMAVLTPEGRVLHANDALCEMLGYTRAELRRFGLRAIVHADDVDADNESRAALLSGVQPEDRRELRWRHKRGRTVWASVTRVLRCDEDGRPRFFVDQLQDLTERRRAEKEIVLLNNLLEQRIRRRTRELEESNEDLREFAYSLAHDLRGPLASIGGFSAQLERTLAGKLDERERHYLRRVRAGVQNMSELTDGLLALADISRTELARHPVDLSAIATEIAERLREQEPQRHVEMRIEATPPASGDPRLLANVMENLLGNAWKFTSRVAQARIAFGAERTPEGLRYFVSDNGAGFDAAHSDKLFTPFQRLHTNADFEGNGIGLALARKILTRHGGQIWAEARLGEGATFYFTAGNPAE
jgi:PAS domain S-box-containing protein